DNNQVKSDLEFYRNSKDQISEKIASLQDENKSLCKANDDLIEKLNIEMKEAAKSQDFEKAANLRDSILELKA
ncbi:MAG: UvrB/UvrC motif-containing protein, partial [Tetragenococcus halophilus]|nr:UvrB/UvrC motif-containing protein [Tetragenococcus halophilus]